MTSFLRYDMRLNIIYYIRTILTVCLYRATYVNVYVMCLRKLNRNNISTINQPGWRHTTGRNVCLRICFSVIYIHIHERLNLIKVCPLVVLKHTRLLWNQIYTNRTIMYSVCVVFSLHVWNIEFNNMIDFFRLTHFCRQEGLNQSQSIWKHWVNAHCKISRLSLITQSWHELNLQPKQYPRSPIGEAWSCKSSTFDRICLCCLKIGHICQEKLPITQL